MNTNLRRVHMKRHLQAASAVASRVMSSAASRKEHHLGRTFASGVQQRTISALCNSRGHGVVPSAPVVHRTGIPAHASWMLCFRSTPPSQAFLPPSQVFLSSRSVLVHAGNAASHSIASLRHFSGILAPSSPRSSSASRLALRAHSRSARSFLGAAPRVESRQRQGGEVCRKYHFRQYQGWEGDGPAPNRFTLLIRPLLFAAGVVLTTFALAAIVRDERARASKASQMLGGLRPAQKVSALLSLPGGEKKE
jgi:hypothetical protein